MALIPFMANHEDLSTCRGYQFKFFCDRCGNGYVTMHQIALTGIAGVILGFLDLLGVGRWFSAWWLAGEIKEYGRLGKPHDDAFAKAVQECKSRFRRCPHCSKWVCPENCWNLQVGKCRNCAPVFQSEAAAPKAQAAVAAASEQILEKAKQVDYEQSTELGTAEANPNADAAAAIHFCSECGAKASGGRFCAACGKALPMQHA